MLQPKRTPIERPPSKIAGLAYVMIGIMALGIAAFVIFSKGANPASTSNIWVGFGIVISLYGVFRIFTGIFMIRKAGGLKNSVILNGHDSSPKPPIP